MKKILLSVAVFLLLCGAAFLMLISPGNPFTRLFRGKITATDARVIVGPYPLEADFHILQNHGVTTIVSLLDARLPYEKILLEREQVLAQKYGIAVQNFPMASVFGQPLDADREHRIKAAAEAVTRAPGKVYLHCYLGIHRAKNVSELARNMGATTDTYLVRQGERSQQARDLDQAQAEYDAGRYQEALHKLKQLPQLDTRAQLLQAWAVFRMDNVTGAGELFNKILATLPQNAAAHIGAGYCTLRENNLPAAEQHFQAALSSNDKDAEALFGLGLVKHRQGKAAAAAQYLTTALEINPKNEEARQLLSQLRPPPK